MSTNNPMTPERLAGARVTLDEDMSQWGAEYGADLLAEVERLRAKPPVDDAMVERAATALFLDRSRTNTEDKWARFPEVMRESWRMDARAALDAALDGDMLQWQREYNADLVAEVKRLRADNEQLRALTTVDEDMVERAEKAYRATFNAWRVKRSRGDSDNKRVAAMRSLEDSENRMVAAMRAALNAALGTGEGS